MTQFGVWVTNKPVPFQRHRYATATEMQEGVVDSGDYKVTQNSGGANMSVDVAIGKAWIAIDTGARNGLAFSYSDAQEDPAIAASNATNPRIDQVVLQYNDTSIPAGVGGDVPTVRVLTGTPTAGATLDNRNGALALPNDCVRLADILVPAASSSVVTANIRDRRPWARGAYRWLTWNGATISSGSAILLTSSLQPRVECSGVPMRAHLQLGYAQPSTAAQGFLDLDMRVDAVAAAPPAKTEEQNPSNTTFQSGSKAWGLAPAAGSHVIAPYGNIGGGAAGITIGSASYPTHMILEEIVRQNADNT